MKFTQTFAFSCVVTAATGLSPVNAAETVSARLARDLEAGVITSAEAATLRAIAALRPARLPEAYSGLEIEPVRCATSILKAAKAARAETPEPLRSALDDIFEGGGACGPGQYPFSITSKVRPISVHYHHASQAATAALTLQYAEEAWAYQVDVMGFTAPLPDMGLCGSDGNIDIYLRNGDGGAYVLDVAPNHATSWDDHSCFMVIDPQVWGGTYLESTVWHEFNHMCQAADDWWEVGASFEATSTFIEEIVDDDLDYYMELLWDFTSRPQRPFEWNDDYSTFFMYAASMQLMFLHERYFDGDPSFIADAWRASRSPARNCYCNPQLNEPDMLDGFAEVLSKVGVTLDEALLEFSRWRWFVGPNDDGAHFEEGALWPANTTPPFVATASTSAFPTTLNITSTGPWSHGAAYVRVLVNTPTQARIKATFSSAAATQWNVETLRVGTDADWRHGLNEPGDVYVETGGASAVIFKVFNRAPVGYDPDYLQTTAAPFSLQFSLAPTADLTGDGLVNGADLAALLAQWGTDGSADLTGDSVVNGADLAMLLANWSP